MWGQRDFKNVQKNLEAGQGKWKRNGENLRLCSFDISPTWWSWACLLVFHSHIYLCNKNSSIKSSMVARRKPGVAEVLWSSQSLPCPSQMEGKGLEDSERKPWSLQDITTFPSVFKPCGLEQKCNPHVILIHLHYNHQNSVFQEQFSVHKDFLNLFRYIFNPFSPLKTGSCFCQLSNDSIMRKMFRFHSNF